MAVDGGQHLAVLIVLRVERQVEEVLQHVELALVGVDAGGVAVVEVDLRTAVVLLGIGMVDEHVVVGVGHDVGDVVVVTHAEGHVVRVGLAQVGLGIVGYLVVVLIPIDGRVVVDEGRAVLVCGGILLVGKDLPSGAEHLEGTGGHLGHLHTDGRAGQHGVGLGELTDLRHAALELQVDVDDVTLGDRHDVGA